MVAASVGKGAQRHCRAHAPAAGRRPAMLDALETTGTSGRLPCGCWPATTRLLHEGIAGRSRRPGTTGQRRCRTGRNWLPNRPGGKSGGSFRRRRPSIRPARRSGAGAVSAQCQPGAPGQSPRLQSTTPVLPGLDRSIRASSAGSALDDLEDAVGKQQMAGCRLDHHAAAKPDFISPPTPNFGRVIPRQRDHVAR